VRFRKLHKDARAPEKAHEDDAGWDLFAIENVTIKKGGWALVHTGIAIELPSSQDVIFEAQVRGRSGLRLRHGLFVPTGTIDTGYRGDVGCIVFNASDEKYKVKKGQKICQLVVATLPHTSFVEAEELSESLRGEGGFGSTGN
jgi:dUTP pyrophosphatase